MAEDSKIMEGSVVRLKSGGPAMTVETILPTGGVRCDWFAKNNRKREVFSLKQLVPVEQPPPINFSRGAR